MGNGIIKWSTFSPLFGIPICMVDIDPWFKPGSCSCDEMFCVVFSSFWAKACTWLLMPVLITYKRHVGKNKEV
jgi:hypothetical protein